MKFEELSYRFDAFTAELVRQALTLEEFAELEIEELAPYFELRAERLYEEYRKRFDAPADQARSPQQHEDYLGILRRRWQEAEELAHIVMKAETSAREATEVNSISA
jgi:hypothetical protein